MTLPRRTLIAAAASAAAVPARAAPLALPNMRYDLSWHAGDIDANGQTMHGVELKRIVAHNGRLYAENTLWTESDSAIPKACQLLVKDSATSGWKLLHQFPRRNLRLVALQPVTFTTDAAARRIAPVSMLLTAPDQLGRGEVQVFSLDDTTQTLTATTIGNTNERYGDIRAIGTHRDAATGVHHVFAGSSALGIVRGAYDPRVPGRIVWQATEHNFLAGAGVERERVMAFAVANGVLHAATSTTILRRGDGHAPSWSVVKTYPNEVPASGIRGLTTVPNPAGSGECLLFNARGGEAQGGDLRTRVHRLDAAYADTVEIDLNADLSRRLNTPIPYVLAAYNDYCAYTLPTSGETVWLCGIEHTYTPAAVQRHPDWRVMHVEAANQPHTHRDQYYAAEARYYVRRVANGTVSWELYEIADPKRPTLVSTCTIAASPFAEEKGRGVLYFGGYDPNFQPSHNTAWIYRGMPGDG